MAGRLNKTARNPLFFMNKEENNERKKKNDSQGEE